MALEELTLRSSDGAYERAAWFWPGPDTDHRLGICLDGEHYLERLEALPLLEALSTDGVIAPMSWLFIASGGAEARHADFTCNRRFAAFVGREVVDWARARHPGIAAAGHLVCGLSLSGLAAAHLALLHRDRVSAALCQSGSFWFEPETLAAAARGDGPTGARFWLSVGDQEREVDVSHPPTGLYQAISQIDGVKRARSILEQAACDVRVHVYRGGHDFAPWRAELQRAIAWLLRP